MNGSAKKATETIATVVIYLPSEHTGGEVNLKLGNLEKTLRTEDAGEFETTYLAWYADVHHIVKPLLTGYRSALIYHLTLPSSALRYIRPSSVLSDPAKDLIEAMANWRTATIHMSGKLKRLTYMLDQVFSEIGDISLSSLTGRDKLRVQYLSDAAKVHGFCLFLAHFEHSRHGACDTGEYDDEETQIHDFFDDYSSMWQLSTLYTLEGSKLGAGFPLSEDDFIADVDFDYEEPDDEDYEDHYQCASTTHYFRRNCVLLLPREERREFLSRGDCVAADEWAKLVLIELKGSTSGISEPAICELNEISALATGILVLLFVSTNRRVLTLYI